MSPSESPESVAAARRAQAWSDYWAGGALHSCAGSYAGNYGGAIAAFWREVFAELPADATVLDLCCGNAPLSKLLVEQCELLSRGGAIDAVDAARIAPSWMQALAPAARENLRVHAGVDACALPFAALRFDLCMSQYGIEYVGAGAMAEVARVLKPGARFAAVLHHVDAVPVRIARAELDHLAWLRAADGLLARAATMIEPMARSASPAGQAALRNDAQANAGRSQFNAALQALESRLQSAPFPDVLQEVRDAVMVGLQRARTEDEAAGRAALAQLEFELQANELRQRELAECALDEAALRALLLPLGDATPALRVLEFEQGGIAGWAVSARRS